MEIYKIGLDDRLGKSIPDVNDVKDRKPYLLLEHLDVSNTKDIISKIDMKFKFVECRAILFVKGTQCAGLEIQAARDIEAKYDKRVHFLRYAVPPGSDIPVIRKESFNKFYDQIRNNDDKIDWEIIDRSWPPYLLAGTFLVRALCDVTSETSLKEVLSKQEPSWLKTFWTTLFVEYKDKGGNDNVWKTAGLPTFDALNNVINYSLEQLNPELAFKELARCLGIQ